MAVPPIVNSLFFGQYYSTENQIQQHKNSLSQPSSSYDLSSSSSSSDSQYKHNSCSQFSSSSDSQYKHNNCSQFSSSSESSSSSSSPEIACNNTFLSMFQQPSTVTATKIKRKRKTARLAKLNTSSSSHSIRNSMPIRSANDIELTSRSLFPSTDADQFNPKSSYYIPLTASIVGPTILHND